jgi:hypothetical protein
MDSLSSSVDAELLIKYALTPDIHPDFLFKRLLRLLFSQHVHLAAVWVQRRLESGPISRQKRFQFCLGTGMSHAVWVIKGIIIEIVRPVQKLLAFDRYVVRHVLRLFI